MMVVVVMAGGWEGFLDTNGANGAAAAAAECQQRRRLWGPATAHYAPAAKGTGPLAPISLGRYSL